VLPLALIPLVFAVIGDVADARGGFFDGNIVATCVDIMATAICAAISAGILLIAAFVQKRSLGLRIALGAIAVVAVIVAVEANDYHSTEYKAGYAYGLTQASPVLAENNTQRNEFLCKLFAPDDLGAIDSENFDNWVQGCSDAIEDYLGRPRYVTIGK
jgi:hypothetical protein